MESRASGLWYPCQLPAARPVRNEGVVPLHCQALLLSLALGSGIQQLWANLRPRPQRTELHHPSTLFCSNRHALATLIRSVSTIQISSAYVPEAVAHLQVKLESDLEAVLAAEGLFPKFRICAKAFGPTHEEWRKKQLVISPSLIRRGYT